MPQTRREIQRTCVACRQPGDKRELVRFVRGTTGVVSLDATGRAPGRGAYICPEPECFARAQKTKALDRALKVRLSDSDYRNLADDLRAVIHGNC